MTIVKTTVTHQLIRPSASVVQRSGIIRLGGFVGGQWRDIEGMSADGQIIAWEPANADGAGAWSVALIPNADMVNPANTLYRYMPAQGQAVVFQVPQGGVTKTLKELIVTDPAQWPGLTPVTFGPPNVLTPGTTTTAHDPAMSIDGTSPDQVLNLTFPWAMRHLGAWSSATAYLTRDAVTRLGSTYIAATANTNKPPESSPADWTLMAAAGAVQTVQGLAPDGAGNVALGETALLVDGTVQAVLAADQAQARANIGFTAGVAASLGYAIVTDAVWAGGADPTGVADSTAAIAAALAASSYVFIPAGTYKISSITVPAGTEVLGAPAITYSTALSGGTILAQSDPLQAAAAVTLGAHAILRGIGVSGPGVASSPAGDGIALGGGNVLEYVRVYGFRIGIFGNNSGTTRISHCNVQSNDIAGIANVVDSIIFANYINANSGNGISLSAGSNDNMIIANKIEWNGTSGINVYNAHDNNVVGNVIDRNGAAGVHAVLATSLTITGNMFRRNGATSSAVPSTDCHMHVESCTGCNITANTTATGANDDSTGYVSPAYALVTQSLTDVAVTGNNLSGATIKTLNSITGTTATFSGNIAPGLLQKPELTRTILDDTPATSIAAAGNTTFALAMPPIGQYATFRAPLSFTGRNTSTGTRESTRITAVISRESGNAVVALGKIESEIGTMIGVTPGTGIAISASVSADGSVLSVTVTNNTAATYQVGVTAQ